MKINRYSLLLIAVLIVIVLIVVGGTLTMLYNAAFQQQRAQLTATVQSQARLMEAVARFDKEFSKNDHVMGAEGATLSQIRSAHLENEFFGKTGEFLLGRLEKDKIHFFLPHRFDVSSKDKAKDYWLVMGSTYAEPMQLALSGKSGTIIARDYRGETVLAAYEPVAILDYGIVVKIDVSEIREPYIYVGLISVVIAIVLIFIGALFFLRIVSPIVQRLQESEKYNRMLFETSPIGLVLCNMDGSFVDINLAYANIIGRNIEETMQLSYWDITPVEFKDEEEKQLESLKVMGKYGPYEKEYIHKDGCRVPVSLLGQIIERDGKKYIWSSVEDISQRISNKEELELSASRLNEAQRLAKVGSWELDLLSGELSWSDEIFCIFEVDKSVFEASYEAFLSFIHPDDREIVNQAYSDSLVNRSPYEIIHRLQISDGRTKCVREICETFFDDNNHPIRSVGTVQDITEEKELENEIEKNRARFEAMFQSMSDAVVVADSNRRINSVNNAVTKLFYYDEGELLGYETKMLYANENDFYQTGKRQYSLDVESDQLPYEVEYRKKDGSIFCGETSGTKIVSASGEVLGFVGIIRDITQRKKAEYELEQYQSQLEVKVKERTKELIETQSELVRKERLATLGQLTATVSHELRNPLGAMRPSLYVIEKMAEKKDERVQAAIQRLDRNIDRCDRIIDELLDFTRITELNCHITCVDKWLSSVIEEQFIPEGIQLEINLTLKNIELNIDAERLRRAVINVIENACHAMMNDNQQVVSEKNAQLKIGTVSKGKRIEIEIIDTGTGISKDVIKNIFEPLFSTKGFGVGLGMSAVKQIMKQHGGGIEIESEEGKGTSVILWLPYKAGEEVAAI